MGMGGWRWDKEAEGVQVLEEERSQEGKHLALSASGWQYPKGLPDPKDQLEAGGEIGEKEEMQARAHCKARC